VHDQRQVLEEVAGWKGNPPMLAVERSPRGAWLWCTAAELAGTEAPVRALRIATGLSRTRLDVLTHLRTLVHVDLRAADRTGATVLRGLKRLAGLEHLSLRGLPRTADELEPLRDLVRLTRVELLQRMHPAYRTVPRPTPGREGLGLLAALPRLHTLDLTGCADVDDKALPILTASSALRVVRLPANPGLTAAGVRKLQTACPGLWARPPVGWLGGLLQHRLGWTLEDLLETLVEGPDGPARGQAREAWPALLETQRAPARRWPVVAGLLLLGIARPVGDRLVNPCLECVVELHRLGGDPAPLLPAVVAHLVDQEHALTAERVLLDLARAGLDLAPLVPALQEITCPYSDAVPYLLAVQRAQARAATPLRIPPFAPQLLTWALADGDEVMRARAHEALTDNPRPATWRAMADVAAWGLRDPRPQVRVAGAAAAWRTVRQHVPITPLLPDLAAALLGSHPHLAAVAGDALWACARTGEDLTPVLEALAEVLPGNRRWDRWGCDPDLDAWLTERGVRETLPKGCHTTRQHTDPGLPILEDAPSRCGVCGSERATCVYFEAAYGGVSGGWETWELHCPDCDRYTVVEHDWG